MKRKVIEWESQHYEFNPLTGKIEQSHGGSDNEDGGESFADAASDGGPVVEKFSLTMYGAYTVDDAMHPLRQFNFWMGHTNFDVDENIVKTISRIDGVEVLTVVSRYRFLIAFGKCFKPADVKVEIQRAVCSVEKLDIDDFEFVCSDGKTISEILKTVKGQYSEWSLYVFPNGSYSLANVSEEDFARKKNIMKESVESSGGFYLDNSMLED